MELWPVFDIYIYDWAAGPYAAQCFWDWACIGAGQSDRRKAAPGKPSEGGRGGQYAER